MSKEEKQGFMKGAAILSVTTFLVKLLGLAFSVPIANIVSTEGMSYFYTAYDIFIIFLLLSTSGIPVAVSRMVSTSFAQGEKANAEKIHKVTMYIYIVVGALGTLVMFFFAEQTAALMGNPSAKYCVMALAPTTFFISITSTYRGYFQGRSNMTPTGVSQAIEAVAKVFIGIGLAVIVLDVTGSDEYAAAAAIIGVTVSSLFAMLYLMICKWRQNKKDKLVYKENQRATRGTRSIVSELVKFSVPIIAGSCFLSVLDTIDMALVMQRLQEAVGFSAEEASWCRGVLGHARKFFDLPGSFVIPISTSLLPVLSVAVIKNRTKDVTRLANSSMKVTMLISTPAAIGMIVFSKPICDLLLYSNPDAAARTAELLSAMSIAIIFITLIFTTRAIMNSFAKTYIPIRNLIIGGFVKLIMTYILVGIPEINVMGSSISTATAYALIVFLNIRAMKKLVPNSNGFFKTIYRPMLSSICMAVFSYGFYYVLTMFVSTKIAIIPTIFVAIALYAVFALVFKAIDYEDVSILPKGKKIARFLKLKPKE
ncbi:MAG: polysaccharide biosynthesis protein [Clostridia bacterium]